MLDSIAMATIVMFGGNFQIRGLMACDGRLLSIAEYTALFSLLGTTYGGDGISNFAIPDLRGRIPVGAGTGNGLSDIALGQTGGSNNVTLTLNNLPAHNHAIQTTIQVSTAAAGSDEPSNAFLTTTSDNFYATAGSPGNNLGGVSSTETVAGNNAPFNVMPPYCAINYQICYEGIYPSRN